MQFNRQAEIILGNKSFLSDKFDVEFIVEFDDTPDLNHAEVIIYNLSNTTVNGIKSNMPVIINAGYEGDVGSVFIGAIYDMKTNRNGVDRVTVVRAVDASGQRGKLRLNRSYKKGIWASQIIVDLCGLAGISIGDLSLPKDVQYRNGKNVSGLILSVLKNIALDCEAKYHISKGLAFFTSKNKGQDIRFVFNSNTGLIGSPEPFVEEVEVKKDAKGKKGAKSKKVMKEVRGYKVEALLNHRVQADSIIELESRDVSGKYRVRKGSHVFSDSGMFTEMEVV